jgi:hypothetical protein
MRRPSQILRIGMLGTLYGKVAKRFPAVASNLDHRWKVLGWDGKIAEVTDGHSRLYMTRIQVGNLIVEAPLWETQYVPAFSLRGKTVLDIGAGCGESAQFFFKLGASKVVCVESDKEACALLRVNSSINGWNVEVVENTFEPEHLSVPHDFMKMDIEGGEGVLLSKSVDHIGPCRMELHEQWLGHDSCVRLIEKFGLKHIEGMIWGVG